MFANRNRIDTEWVQEHERNRYKTGTEQISSGNGTDTEQ